MFVSRNHGEFNDALNKFAGTNGVGYAAPWDMSTHSGRQYLSTHHDVAGREFARAALDQDVNRGGSLATEHVLAAPTPIQKAALFAMRDSTSATQFDAALRLAVRSGALAPVAMTVFAPPHTIAMQAPSIVPVLVQAALTDVKSNLLDLSDDMQVDSHQHEVPSPAEIPQQHVKSERATIAELLADSPSAAVAEYLAESPRAAVAEHLAESPQAAVAGHLTESPQAAVAVHLTEPPQAAVAEQLEHVSSAAVPVELAARTPGMSGNSLVAPVKRRRKAR